MGGSSRFHQALRDAYRSDPCGVLPNPLWKTLEALEGLHTSCRCLDGCAHHLEIRGEEQLVMYWDAAPQSATPLLDRLRGTAPADGVRFALLHKSRVTPEVLALFPQRQAFFRLLHRAEARSHVALPDGYQVVEADPPNETEAVAELIGACYEWQRPTPDAVMGWTQHPAYDPGLWIWIVDTVSATPVALGIAELDRAVPEAALEYIQVLPSHRRRGLGAALVSELLRRVHGRVAFTTVSGEVDSPWRPEALYRRCGFVGDDVWYVLRR